MSIVKVDYGNIESNGGLVGYDIASTSWVGTRTIPTFAKGTIWVVYISNGYLYSNFNSNNGTLTANNNSYAYSSVNDINSFWQSLLSYLTGNFVAFSGGTLRTDLPNSVTFNDDNCIINSGFTSSVYTFQTYIFKK